MSPAPLSSCKIARAAPLVSIHLYGNHTIKWTTNFKHGGRSSKTFSEDISRVRHLCRGARNIWALWNYAQRVAHSSARKTPGIFREIAHQTNHWWYVIIIIMTHTQTAMGVAIDRYLALFVHKLQFLRSPLKTACTDFSHPCLLASVDLCNTYPVYVHSCISGSVPDKFVWTWERTVINCTPAMWAIFSLSSSSNLNITSATLCSEWMIFPGFSERLNVYPMNMHTYAHTNTYT